MYHSHSKAICAVTVVFGLIVTKITCVNVCDFLFLHKTALSFCFLLHYKELKNTSLLKPFVFMLCNHSTQSLKATSIATEGHLTFQLTTHKACFFSKENYNRCHWVNLANPGKNRPLFHFKCERATKNFWLNV